MLRHGVVRVVEQVRGVQKRLGGDAPHVQARAAQRASPLDAGDFQPELRALDGGDVPAGAAADHDDVLPLAGVKEEVDARIVSLYPEVADEVITQRAVGAN